ncbi:uncharacterized protein LTR77_010052 [Saxophila tyrrhenica]|uniref:Arb2 domain-containing protein n=1 Tax=Saxophila tyrrhenica TaxID=1690608 RepID=A0AAV9NXM6_9PEZI|nr:hypothetical protein LTR77_010052 [Saxophila tyrrhenica]
MFVRTDKDLPVDPSYPADLTQLNYKLDDKGEFVKITNPEGPNKHFTFFISSSDRVNEVHKEATHTAVREIIKGELSKFGVRELFLAGGGGDEVLGGVQPKDKHMVVMTSDVEVLKEKNDVIVIVGELNQDMGVWAWRSCMREGGINGGSVVGMMKKLQALDMNKPESGVHPVLSSPPVSPVDGVFDFGPAAAAMLEASKAQKMPGIIILNPGQLHYSHKEGKCMSWPAWSARKRASAIAKGFVIDEEYNRVPGHSHPEEHIATMFEKVIPQLIRKDAKLYVLGVTDGAERFIKWAGAALEANPDSGIANQVHAMAFTEPTHNPGEVQVSLRVRMLHAGRAWVRSTVPLGTYINSPGATAEDRLKIGKAAKEKAEEEEEGPKEMASNAGNKITHNDHDEATPEEPVDLTDSATSLTHMEASPSKSHISNYDDDFVEMRALSESIEQFKECEATNKEAREKAKAAGVPVLEVEDVTAAADELDLSSMRGSTHSEKGEEEVDGADDYSNLPVSVATFSGGVSDIDEMLVPTSMDLILEWFVRRSEMS